MMKPKTPEWTIVLVGAWNVRLMSPQWLGRSVFEGQDLTIEVPVGPAVAPTKYTAGNLIVVPRWDRLIVGVTKSTLKVMEQAESVAHKILRMLPHTPVTAFGVNLAYDETEPNDKQTALFKFSDLDDLSAFGATINKSGVARALSFEGLNLNVRQQLSEGRLELHLNFHQQVASATEAADQLSGRVVRCGEVARSFINRICASDVEEEKE